MVRRRLKKTRRRVDPQGAWRVLTESVQDYADGFADTDPANGPLYRRDADAFCDRLPPHDEEEALDRYAEAADLRERWGTRSMRWSRPRSR